jgi:FAD/FMN-containing dehydrogenase
MSLLTTPSDDRARILADGAVHELRQSLTGEVITPRDPGYEAARRVWNGAIDRRPALIARPQGVAEVVEAVRFARSERLLTAVRGGGHNVAGHATCDDGMVIDLSRMRAVRIDPEARVAHVQGGALWVDVDYATQAFGLGVPGGMISSTGVAGLTLGGGIGWLSRKHGLTSDNLLSARLVTADGEVLTASADEHAELFWALRGGGGNFGVVTDFEFRLHPVGDVLGGVILQPLDAAGEFLRDYREVAAGAPDELATVLNFMTVPPLAAFPAELHGRKVLAVGISYAGDPAEGDRAIAPLRRLGAPVLERIGVMQYAVRQQLQDASAPAGLCNYWKSDYLTGLDDDLIDLMVDRARLTTSPLTQLHLYQLGGAAGRRPDGATAYAHRSAPWLFSIVSLWTNPAVSAPHIAWARSFASHLRRHTAGAYVNFLGDEGDGRVRDAYGVGKYGRLAAVKAAYDPDNFFRCNHNIEPAS